VKLKKSELVFRQFIAETNDMWAGFGNKLPKHQTNDMWTGFGNKLPKHQTNDMWTGFGNKLPKHQGRMKRKRSKSHD